MNTSNCRLSPYSGFWINTISCLWPAVWMYVSLSVEPGGAICFNSVLWYHPSDGDGTKLWQQHDLSWLQSSCKGLLCHQCLQARLVARHRANLGYQWGTPIRPAESHYYTAPCLKLNSSLKGGVGVCYGTGAASCCCTISWLSEESLALSIQIFLSPVPMG